MQDQIKHVQTRHRKFGAPGNTKKPLNLIRWWITSTRLNNNLLELHLGAAHANVSKMHIALFWIEKWNTMMLKAWNHSYQMSCSAIVLLLFSHRLSFLFYFSAADFISRSQDLLMRTHIKSLPLKNLHRRIFSPHVSGGFWAEMLTNDKQVKHAFSFPTAKQKQERLSKQLATKIYADASFN